MMWAGDQAAFTAQQQRAAVAHPFDNVCQGVGIAVGLG